MNLPMRLFIVLACLLCASVTARAASITNVGLLDGGEYTEVDGLNGDGSVAVGYGSIPSGDSRAFRWTATSGTLQDLGVFPGDINSIASAVSGDGSVVVGMSWNSPANTSRAFRWTTTSGTMEDLGRLPGDSFARATALTPDGSTIVGTSSGSSEMAVRWTSGGIQPIGLFSGGSYSFGNGVSNDGSVVAGYGDIADTPRAYRWTAASGTLQDLGTLPGGSGTTQTIAWGVNGDGSVVVGAQGTGAEMRAFRWTLASGTMQDLGPLPDSINTRAWAVSADGATVVGEAEDNDGNLRAFLWTPTLGIQDINTYLPSLGVDLTDWVLNVAFTVSADGNWIGGIGVYQGTDTGFVANITPVPEPSTWAMTVAAIACGGALTRFRRFRSGRDGSEIVRNAS